MGGGSGGVEGCWLPVLQNTTTSPPGCPCWGAELEPSGHHGPSSRDEADEPFGRAGKSQGEMQISPEDVKCKPASQVVSL